jgi:hypothetical protein
VRTWKRMWQKRKKPKKIQLLELAMQRRSGKGIKKSASEWLYYIGSAKQVSDYKALTEHLINLIKQNSKLGIDITSAMVKQELI